MACSREGTVLYLRHMNEKEAQLLNTLETVTVQMGAAVSRCSRDFRYLWANQAYANWVDRPLNEIVGRPILEVLGKNDFEALLPHFNRALTGEAVRYEQEKNFRGIGPRWISTVCTPTLGVDGTATGWVAVLLDITERKRADESAKLFRALLDQSNDAIEVVEPETLRILDVNEKACHDLGYSREELLSLRIPDIDPFADESRGAKVRDELSKQGFTVMETRHRRKDGSVFPVEVSIKRVVLDRPYVVTVARDITQRKQAENSLNASEMRYRRIVETTNEGVWLLDSDFCTSYVNQQMAELLGYEPEEMVGSGILEFYFSEDIERKKQTLNRRRQGLHEQIEERLRRKDGSELWVRMSGTPVFKDNGDFDGAFAMVTDITGRKRAEDALKESEQRFRLIADSAPVMVWMSGLDKRPTYFNRLWLEFTGQSETDLQNGLAGIVHPEDYAKCHDIYCRGFDQRQPFKKECRLRRHDGQYRWMLDVGVPRFQPDGSFAGYIGSCVDITEQKLAEEALSSISRRLIEAQEQERTWIARELHDDISQRLALVAMDLDRKRQGLQVSTAGMRPVVNEAIKRISDVVSDVHSLSHRLHSSKLDILGLAAAAEGFCREMSRRQNVVIKFQSRGISKTLPEAITLCLFRVLQEALQNATKHSGANQFRVSLVGSKKQIVLTVRDGGRGFRREGAPQRGGLGLTSMMERLKLVGGDLSILAEPQSGTIIRACVPIRSLAKPASASI
jgi:PAS domain S-box-containing protein